MAQYDVDLRDYWRIFRKRKAIVFLMVFLAGVSSYGFAKLKEPVPLYEATAAVKIDRYTNIADFLSGGFWTQAETLTTQAFIITSFPVLVKAAQELEWLSEDLTPEEVQNSVAAMAVVGRLKGMTSAEPEPGTNIVNILVVGSDPYESEKTANAFARAFRRFNIEQKNKQIFETKEFIEKQLSVTSRQLKRAEENLRTFEETNTLIALDAQTSALVNRITSLDIELDRIKRNRHEIQELSTSISHAEHAPQDVRTRFSPAVKGSPVESLGIQLREMVLKRQDLLFDYTERHPLVLEVDEQIQSVIREIATELDTLLIRLASQESGIRQRLEALTAENRSIPKKALELARLQRELSLQSDLYSQLKTRYQETQIKASGQIEEVTIIRPATLPQSPINIPSKAMIIVTGLVMGLVIGIVFTFIAETLDTSIGTIEDVENLLNIPVLGVIPFWEKEEGGKRYAGSARYQDLVAHFDPKSLAAEAFRSLRTNLQFISIDRSGKSFLITSSFVQEGKTANVVNLALSMAQAGDKVLLVEGDLRKSLVHKMFGIDKAPGMTDYVLGNYNWQDITVTITDVMLGEYQIEDILRTPGLDNLTIMTAGTNPPNPSEILRSPQFKAFLAEAYEEYDFIFIDAPPVLPVADATEIATLVDGVILVYKVGAIARGILNRAKLTLDNVNAKVLGVILNNVKPEMGPDYFKYHAHYYYGPPSDTEGETLFSGGKLIRYLFVVVAAALLLLGIFWNDLFSGSP